MNSRIEERNKSTFNNDKKSPLSLSRSTNIRADKTITLYIC